MPIVAALTAAGLTASCGSSGAQGHSTGGTADRGPITYVQGKDNSGDLKNIIAKWNSLHPDQKVNLKEQSDNADEQHDDLVQHFEAKDSGYDVVAVDVVWTSEFAAKQWLEPLTGAFAVDTAPMLPVTVRAASYNGTLYAAPGTSDGGMLYYRTDLVSKPPATWGELTTDCRVARAHHISCYAGQFAKYEGLTVNVSEAIASAGGRILTPDGKAADVDTPQAAKGLSFLADGFSNGDIPEEAITFEEEQGRQAFEAGKLLFLRNWSYVYNLAAGGGSGVRGKFAVAREPGLSGPGTGIIGGHSLGMSVYSRHKATALDFMKFYESPAIQRELLVKASNAPVLRALYTDPALLADPALGYLRVLGESLATAGSRPATPFYPGVTSAIQENAYAAIKGGRPVPQALKDMQAAIDSALHG
jgi:multiple sugar transport system substrate-binding protein